MVQLWWGGSNEQGGAMTSRPAMEGMCIVGGGKVERWRSHGVV